jgi:CHAD domain-containing protein
MTDWAGRVISAGRGRQVRLSATSRRIVGRVVSPDSELEPGTVHFDTVDLRLTRAATTLRRRIGGPDQGWFLGLPATVGAGPVELRRPIGSNPTPVPVALLGLLRARLRGAPLVPFVQAPAPVAAAPPPTSPDRVGVRACFAELVELDPWVRLDAEGRTQLMAEKVDRLCALLPGFGPVRQSGTDKWISPVPPLGDLGWLAARFEPARDVALLSSRARAELDRLPADSMIGPVRQRIERELGRLERQARVGLVQALNSQRYLELLDTMDHLVATDLGDPSRGDGGDGGDGTSALTRLVTEAQLRVPAASAGERNPRDVLQAVRRARYVAEAVTGTFGRPARRYARAARKLQIVLEQQLGAELLRAWLLTVATRAHLAEENAFSYGRMHAGPDRPGGSLEADLAAAHSRLLRRARVWPVADSSARPGSSETEQGRSGPC